jgi:hypothetical protein
MAHTFFKIVLYMSIFLTWTVVGGEWSASCPGRLISAISLVWGCLGGPQNCFLPRGVDRNLTPYRGLNSNLLAVQPVASRYVDCSRLVNGINE